MRNYLLCDILYLCNEGLSLSFDFMIQEEKTLHENIDYLQNYVCFFYKSYVIICFRMYFRIINIEKCCEVDEWIQKFYLKTEPMS